MGSYTSRAQCFSTRFCGSRVIAGAVVYTVDMAKRIEVLVGDATLLVREVPGEHSTLKGDGERAEDRLLRAVAKWYGFPVKGVWRCGCLEAIDIDCGDDYELCSRCNRDHEYDGHGPECARDIDGAEEYN